MLICKAFRDISKIKLINSYLGLTEKIDASTIRR
jgi:hypothetical protein